MMVMCCQDDEISSTTEMVQKLQEQMAEQEELIAAAERERDNAQAESQRQQSLSEASMNEVKEVLQALEELALSYEQKTQEVLEKDRDNETLTEELTRKKVLLWFLYGAVNDMLFQGVSFVSFVHFNSSCQCILG